MPHRTVGDLLDAPAPPSRRDRELLLEHLLERSRAWLLSHRRDPVTAAQFEAWEQLVCRVEAGEPLAYVLGTWSFYGLELKVTPDTLVPRPETEELVDQVLGLLPTGSRARVVDLGTGSGAIALALAHSRPSLKVEATDRSAKALAVARRNARRLSLDNVAFFCGSWWEAIGTRTFDLVVSNPPYVVPGDSRLTAQGEPSLALFGGADGLDAYRALVAGLDKHLETGGSFLVEHGLDQQRDIAALLGDRFGSVQALRDLAGHPRMIVATEFRP